MNFRGGGGGSGESSVYRAGVKLQILTYDTNFRARVEWSLALDNDDIIEAVSRERERERIRFNGLTTTTNRSINSTFSRLFRLIRVVVLSEE